MNGLDEQAAEILWLHLKAAREVLADYIDPEARQNPQRAIDELLGILDAEELVAAMGVPPLISGDRTRAMQ